MSIKIIGKTKRQDGRHYYIARHLINVGNNGCGNPIEFQNKHVSSLLKLILHKFFELNYQF